jgi:hypothetical protein
MAGVVVSGKASFIGGSVGRTIGGLMIPGVGVGVALIIMLLSGSVEVANFCGASRVRSLSFIRKSGVVFT